MLPSKRFSNGRKRLKISCSVIGCFPTELLGRKNSLESWLVLVGLERSAAVFRFCLLIVACCAKISNSVHDLFDSQLERAAEPSHSIVRLRNCEAQTLFCLLPTGAQASSVVLLQDAFRLQCFANPLKWNTRIFLSG